MTMMKMEDKRKKNLLIQIWIQEMIAHKIIEQEINQESLMTCLVSSVLIVILKIF
jgi:hypothetical protein